MGALEGKAQDMLLRAKALESGDTGGRLFACRLAGGPPFSLRPERLLVGAL